MSQVEISAENSVRRVTGNAARFALPVSVLGVLGLGMLVYALLETSGSIRIGLELCATVLIAFSGLAMFRLWFLARQLRGLRKVAAQIARNDPLVCLMTDATGRILDLNGLAEDQFAKLPEFQNIAEAFKDRMANPVEAALRLQDKAQSLGVVKEDMVNRLGHWRLSISHVGRDTYLWRIEDLTETDCVANANDGHSLPMLTAGPSGTILYMNEAFRRVLGGRVKHIDRIFETLPLVTGQIHNIRAQQGVMACVVAEVASRGGRREIYLLPSTEDAVVPQSGAPEAHRWDVIDELPVPLLKVSPDGLIYASNQQARDLLGARIDDATRMADLLEGLGRPIADWLAEAAAGKGRLKPEFLQSTTHEDELFIQVTLTPVNDGDAPYLLATLNDVTEFKSLERQFVQSQKMQAIGQLAGGVAHDFNNLLTAISGHCDLLLLRHDQGDQDYSDLVQIHQNTNRAAALVRQLLAYSRKQNLQPETLDLRNTLSESTHLLNRLVGEKISLTVDHDPGLDPIRADRRQLEQVLMNLVVNARDAMPSGGRIEIKTANLVLETALERDRATVPEGRYVCLTVRDTGTGIAPQIAKKVFEPFYSTKKPGEGTGLGLSTAYGIIKQTGGFIFLDTVPGQGTTFTIYMPAYDGPLDIAKEAPSVDPVLPMDQADGVVLLVEDEAPVRAFAARALRLRGYTVLEAESAEFALDLLEDRSVSVDIFVTDVIMPGMDGPTWVRQALQSRPEAKVVFVSGYAEETFGEDQKAIPNSVFLPKPFSLTELTRTVTEQLLDRAS